MARNVKDGGEITTDLMNIQTEVLIEYLMTQYNNSKGQSQTHLHYLPTWPFFTGLSTPLTTKTRNDQQNIPK